MAGVLLLLVGCGGPRKIRPRYSLSGKVTYRGAPVPHGTIFFQPDGAKGNNGPAVSAPIINGAYETLPGRGPTGGASLAFVAARIAPGGKTRDRGTRRLRSRCFPRST